ncbi:hypothetical protein BJY04DRAFT_214119 [Aspergillus karnatakaensis]|uniref:Zn(II)2Cys6 transcription factor domain-containing protein n=1 Tax=Aspergillus karnatakaensis TaxID=1810916 RepID=UPI003CCDE356
MLRRSHKKSRGGCVQCKRRHIKCDERRPACALCTMTNRECSFTTQPPTPPGTLPSTTPSPSPVPTHLSTDEINLTHMELLLHLTSTKEIFSLADGAEPYSSGVLFSLKTALASPYLFYEFLAFSACHLAHVSPAREAHYLHQAITLQTKAISLFNAEKLEVNKSNCVPVLLFTIILGHHLLADTLRTRVFKTLSSFLTHYIQCAATHRGIFTILNEAKPLLMESELNPVLSRSFTFTSSTPRGSTCARLTTLISTSPTLTESEKNLCHRAIKFLQLGFDALDAPAEHEGNRFQMLFLWTVVVPPEFMALISAKRVEALVIFAFYAKLLVAGRGIWQVGEAGSYILGMIRDEVGPLWDGWIYPAA